VEYLPAAQLMHVSLTMAPTVVEYLPLVQSRHVAVTDAPTLSEYLPALQSAHAAEPAVVLYLPLPHAVHGPPSGPE
jgi:hypothetical protein